MTLRSAGSLCLAATGLLACLLALDASSLTLDPAPASLARAKVMGAPDSSFNAFLDRLMQAESGGRELAANPRSTALGPFQFIKATFIDVTRRHFAAEVAGLTEEQILALRTNREFSRRAAAAYCRDSALYVSEQGLDPTFAHLRLAFLLGPYAAVRVLQASSGAPVSELLGPAVLKANPFMIGMTAADLIAKAERDVSHERGGPDLAVRPHMRTALARPTPEVSPRPRVAERANCNQKLASCRRWTALRTQKPRVADSRAQDKGQQRKKRHAG